MNQLNEKDIQHVVDATVQRVLDATIQRIADKASERRQALTKAFGDDTAQTAYYVVFDVIAEVLGDVSK